jgi:hypothetical protein
MTRFLRLLHRPPCPRREKRLFLPHLLPLLVFSALAGFGGGSAVAQTASPQVIKMRYEAQDPRVGGNFIVWVEREKIWYGLDPRLYPAARTVEVTHITPSPGAPLITVIAVTSINATTPDYFHIAGTARFRTSGMVLRQTSVP